MTIFQYDLNQLVSPDHALRQVARVVDFGRIARKYTELKTTVGRKGYGVEVGIKCLFPQFYYDLSDRQLEERLRHDLALRWFCGLGLETETPDHTFCCRIRQVPGTQRIGQVFKNIRQHATEAGLVRSVFTFVDASAIVTKATTWAERDAALAAGEAALNNQTVSQYSADQDARVGCKGTERFWYGYQRHVSVDMGSGLIRAVAVTPAHVPDHRGLRHICPDGGMVVGDKGYCPAAAQRVLRAHRCHDGTIKRRNMKTKDPDKDRWLTKIRAPFESVFSQQESRARYRGWAKVQLQAFLEAIVFNVRRLVTLHAPPLYAGA